ncbi:unnamed protein product [Sympodiomycopsis kandeliae]
MSTSTSNVPLHLQHIPGPPLPVPQWVPKGILLSLVSAILSAATRLETSTSMSLSIERFKHWLPNTTRRERFKFAFMIALAIFSMFIMGSPSFPLKLAIPALYITAILLPITSQFFLPASPIFLWLLFYYSSGFLAPSTRPHIWVSVLPTLETIWYGANISDILTRAGHPILDVFAWIPYGIVHFAGPFFVAAFLFVFGPPGSVKFFGSAFGFLNIVGVLIQVSFPTAPPWYELREGLTPANYAMKGSPAGLARIDALFHGHGYTLTFSNAPVPFGAFPSLHAGSATMEALFCSYFFPLQFEVGGFIGRLLGRGKKLAVDARILYWTYAFWLYWCTMYLMHHYLVDLVGGGCLATLCFYLFLDDTQRHYMEESYPVNPSQPAPYSTLQASHSHLNLGTPSRQPEEFSLDPLRSHTAPNKSLDEEETATGVQQHKTLFSVVEESEEEAAAAAALARSRGNTPRPPSTAPEQRASSKVVTNGKAKEEVKTERDSFDDWD